MLFGLANARGHTCVLAPPSSEEGRMETGADGGHEEEEEEDKEDRKCDVCMLGVLPLFMCRLASNQLS